MSKQANVTKPNCKLILFSSKRVLLVVFVSTFSYPSYEYKAPLSNCIYHARVRYSVATNPKKKNKNKTKIIQNTFENVLLIVLNLKTKNKRLLLS